MKWHMDVGLTAEGTAGRIMVTDALMGDIGAGDTNYG